ncbi:MAG: sigma-70 family RNA polymerase sigma factor [Saprospiraceae bacterium]|nr:sigma-70 family RNA polymerase sigma factor [Saprospiraceae bacterium]
MDPGDQYLLQGCRKGNAKAQKSLYEKYKTTMFRLCLRYAGNKEEAEDLLQDGFIKVFADLHQFKGEGPLGAWIRRVILNVVLQHLRRQKLVTVSREVPEEADEEQDESPFPLDAQVLTILLQQLPVGYRTVLNLFVLENYSHADIAASLGISVNTSKTQLLKAKKMLRKLVACRLADKT